MSNYKAFSIFKEIDLFGKEPDIYYKGKQRKTSWMGRICTWIYVSIYIFFFIYKLIRMFKRVDVSFSETNSSTGGLPKIHMTKEIFTYALALADRENNPFIDETIYRPIGIVNIKRNINGEVKDDIQQIEFGVCNIDDFGKDHQQFAKKLNLSNYYCFKNLDIDFEGYSSAENSTTIIIQILKCKGQTLRGEPCKKDDEIISKLDQHSLLIISEDYDITPYDFNHPVKPKLDINTCPISLDQYQSFVGYYQLANIETDHNLFGFEALADIRSEKYLIYHSALIMATKMLPDQISVIQYYIMMTEKILTNQRTYTQLIDVLGDVGGLMEVMESVFGVICIFVADILYDKTMVNNLFAFDLEDYMVKIKTKSKIKNRFKTSKSLNINLNNDDNFDKGTIDISKKALNNIRNDDSLYSKKDSIQSKLHIKKKANHENCSNNNINISSSERRSYFKRNTLKIQKSVFVNNAKTFKENNKEFDSNLNNIKIYEHDKEIIDTPIHKKKLIKKLDTNVFCTYFCFCCSRKRENFGNALLDEAMGIITEKLDIYNIFRNMYYIDDVKMKSNYEYEDFEISDECKEKLKEISSKIYNSFYKL